VTQIDADLKVKSQAYNSLKGNLQNLERKATYVIYLIIFKFKLEVDIILLLLLSTSSVTTMECGPCTLFDSVAHFRSDYYQLQSLWPAVRRVQCSSEDATKLMVQAFVISCLDYCNRPCYGITNELTRCLQSVEIAATMLVMGTRQCDHISPVLCQLHWFPVRQCIMFKIATLIYRSLSSNALGYLVDDCQLVADTPLPLLGHI